MLYIINTYEGEDELNRGRDKGTGSCCGRLTIVNSLRGNLATETELNLDTPAAMRLSFDNDDDQVYSRTLIRTASGLLKSVGAAESADR